MNRAVVDTDIVSFLFKNHTLGYRYDAELSGRVPLISFMTVAELERWAIQYRWGPQRVDWLHAYLEWIAATALLHEVPLITHNRTDYLGVAGLNLISHEG